MMKYRNVELNLAKEFDVLNVRNDISVLIAPCIRQFSDAAEGKSEKFLKVRHLVARQLAHIGASSFQQTAITKVVGDRLESIGNSAFKESYYLEQINLQNVRSIGQFAFSSCNLRVVKNKFVTELVKNEFEYNSGLELVKMRNLCKISQSSFLYAVIQTFVAPNVSEIEHNANELQISKNNFKTQDGVLAVPEYCDEEHDFQQMILRLPSESFQTDTVTQQNRGLFSVDNCLVFPPNIKLVSQDVYSDCYSDCEICIFEVFGDSVTKIGDKAFSNCQHLRKVVFPNLVEIGETSFGNCGQLKSFVAPKCSVVGEYSFFLGPNLSVLVMQPKILTDSMFYISGIRFLTLPSVEKVEGYAFTDSLLQGAELANCQEFDEYSLKNCCALGNEVDIDCKNPMFQLHQLEQIVGLTSFDQHQLAQLVKKKLRFGHE